MVGKRRPRKTKPPYRRIAGPGLPDPDLAAQEAPTFPENTGKSGANDFFPSETSDFRETKLNNEFFTNESLLIRGTAQLKLHTSKQLKDFPAEIIDLVVFFCEKKFPLLLVNTRWHAMALPHIYAEPDLTPVSFPQFVSSISDSRDLGRHVRSLDLSSISQVGKNSMVSRLLRRCSPKLAIFVAPQSHFGFSPMISLAACHRLRHLDLSLVSETLDLAHLFKTIQNFVELEVLYFPRSSIRCDENTAIEWAPNLRQLGLSGGFPARFLEQTMFPSSLKSLTISNCPYMTTISFNKLLEKVGPQLLHLSVLYPLPHLEPTAADFVLMQCPNLRTWRISIDYVSNAGLDPDLIPPSHPLRQLLILSSGLMGHSDKIKPAHVLMATDALSSLQRVRVSLLLGWKPESSALYGLVEVLNERGGGVWMI